MHVAELLKGCARWCARPILETANRNHSAVGVFVHQLRNRLARRFQKARTLEAPACGLQIRYFKGDANLFAEPFFNVVFLALGHLDQMPCLDGVDLVIFRDLAKPAAGSGDLLRRFVLLIEPHATCAKGCSN